MNYEVRQTEEFSKWLKKLKDVVAKVAIARRIDRMKEGNFGDSKSVGDKVFELKIDEGQGYRVYLTHKDHKIVILLVGGDKSTQDEDIKIAKKMVKEI